ncbi:MAG: S41 family peptidase [Neisseria sp.]|nr:S41 family peptidase [Neisseria sp.]
MSRKNSFKKIAVYVAGTFTGAVLALSMQSFADSRKDALPVQDIRTFAEVYGQIKANYYQQTDDDVLLQGAIKGMVQGLDPHSEYMTAKDFTDLKESTAGEFGGLGMEIGKKDDFIMVIAPIEDTPAERAGVQSGDYIIKIDDESTRGMSTTEAVKKMRGKPGTKITLTLTRKDSSKPIVVQITRAIIKVKSVRSKLLDDGYGYVRVSQFQERTLDDLVKNINDLYKKNGGKLNGLVLDLRDDPGGLLNQAVGVSAVFLPANEVVVSTKGRDGRDAVQYKAARADYLPGRKGGNDPLASLPADIKKIPMTVLINSGSASASEIVTGALQDHRRAVVVGVQSFGKGSVQSVIPLSNGSGVKLTVALYYTPNERSIQAQGIVPDVEIKSKDDVFEMREADLSGHVSNPDGGKEVKGKINLDVEPAEAVKTEEKAKTEEEKMDEILNSRDPNPAKDVQLKTALDLLKNPEQYQQNIGRAASEGRDKKLIEKEDAE